MMVGEGVALTLVLLSALYGCACFITACVRRMWRPKEPRVRLVLTLDNDSNGVEQQVQYARLVSEQTGLMLFVEDTGIADDAKTIADAVVNSM